MAGNNEVLLPDKDEVPLTEAAHFLQVAWSKAWRLLLIGELSGRKVRGRWMVSTESVMYVKAKLTAGKGE